MTLYGKLPDGFLHSVGDHYYLQVSSREGYVALVSELLATGKTPSTYLRIDSDDELDFWLSVFDRLGLWLRMSSLPEVQVYGEQHDASDRPLRSTG